MIKKTAILSALLAALLYALNAPVSKLLLQRIAPSMMAALLYLGAGLGMLALGFLRRAAGQPASGQKLTREDLPYIIGMIVLDVLAPVLLMIGISRTTAANASLLNNFEIVATSLIALGLFREKISPRLWLAIGLIVLSSAMLTLEDAASLDFSAGSVFVLLASCCWGLENNCTRMLSQSDPQEIVVIKGLGSGAGALIVAFLAGETFPTLGYVPAALALGF
ncbi:MAG: DMT family transporter, partial [Clostridia bacterium]|nr:DMT family transporter [Clostridia bacterium]